MATVIAFWNVFVVKCPIHTEKYTKHKWMIIKWRHFELSVSRITRFLKITILRSKILVLRIPLGQWVEIFEIKTASIPTTHSQCNFVSLWKKYISRFYAYSTRSKNRLWWPVQETQKLFLGTSSLSPNIIVLLGKNPEKFHTQSGTDRWDLGEEGGRGRGKREEEGNKKRDWRQK